MKNIICILEENKQLACQLERMKDYYQALLADLSKIKNESNKKKGDEDKKLKLLRNENDKLKIITKYAII
jgi:predicted RNase H-like nuclease (RuvC/YqgF family)